MASTWQFVSEMTASPTVLLDLNSSGMKVLLGSKLGPTQFEKGYADNPLSHGKIPVRASGLNQILEIPVEINKSTPALGAQAVEDLVKQLAVDNILRVQLDGHPAPVFYRTFGNADFAAVMRTVLIQNSTVTLSIEAAPFAYGARVNAGSFTVSNDPAAGTNPCRFDISSVTGDVPTPLFMLATSTGSSGAPSGMVNKWAHFGMRRRGTPSNYSNVIQAENMTQGTGAVVTADATMSGGSKSRIGFATATNVLRLSDTFPENGTAVADARGEYRVYARCAKTVAGDSISVQLGYGASSTSAVFNDAQSIAAVTNPYWVDLGKVPVPSYSDPVTHGFAGGSPLKVLLAFVGIWATRTSGSGSLDIDCLYFLPADDRTLIVRFPTTDTTYAIDGTTQEGGSVYSINTGLDTINTIASPPQIVGGGGFPELMPGDSSVVNRIHLLRNVDVTGTADAITNTTTIQCYYWPRWREYTRP